MIRPTRLEAFALMATDLLLVGLAFLAAWFLRFWFEQYWLQVGVATAPVSSAEPYVQALLVVLAVFHVVLRSRALYDRLPARGIDVVEEVIPAVTLASIAVLAASFFYREVSYSRSVVLLSWALCVALLPLPRLLELRRRRRKHARGEGLVPALVVGSAGRAAELARRLRDHARYGLVVRGLLTPPGGAPDAARGEPAGGDLPQRLGAPGDLAAALESTGAREVLVADALERIALYELLEVCEARGVEARVVPGLYDLFTTERDLGELHGVAFIAIRERRFERLSLAAKRLFDLGAASVLLLLSLPLLALLAWRVRAGSPGPAFFRQRRTGENGRPFLMWKLRSMVVDAEARLPGLVDVEQLAQPVFKLEGDPRVTPIGRALRRWSLDELPQLWNVVTGDMSLVGPRPEEESIVARYDAHHRRRLKAKPGLTGLQQIEARGSPDLDLRIQLDVLYIRRRTFLFDLWILLRTPFAVLGGRGAT